MKERYFDLKLNINTIFTAIGVALISYYGRKVADISDEMIQVRADQKYIIQTLASVVPRTELDLRLEVLKVQIEDVRQRAVANETELIKVKQLFRNAK
jgi:hypothetical protein